MKPRMRSPLCLCVLPVVDFSVNPYVGCLHGFKYCYASFMKRFTNHPEPWGEFIDVKHWPEIKNAKRYAGKEAFFGSVTDCYQPHEAKTSATTTPCAPVMASRPWWSTISSMRR